MSVCAFVIVREKREGGKEEGDDEWKGRTG